MNHRADTHEAIHTSIGHISVGLIRRSKLVFHTGAVRCRASSPRGRITQKADSRKHAIHVNRVRFNRAGSNGLEIFVPVKLMLTMAAIIILLLLLLIIIIIIMNAISDESLTKSAGMERSWRLYRFPCNLSQSQ